ncbi:MAG: NUDIX hydrolase [Cytophagales bacterium]|nr:NUDIX hydrolase [Cytophagales bacterium]
MNNINETNPWKTLSKQDKYDNPWIHVCEHQVHKPNGEPGIYGVVSFKNIATGIVPIDSEGYTYLVGQYRYPTALFTWEIPEGGVPMGQDYFEGAKRELKEETGYTAAKWTYLCKIHTSNSVCDEYGYLYMAEDLTPGDTQFDDTEVIHIKKVHLKDALQMVLDSSITDSMSQVGILMAARLKGY